MMECQCAKCYPESEARRKVREKLDRVAELELLRDTLLSKEDGEAKTFALEECDELIKKARFELFGREIG